MVEDYNNRARPRFNIEVPVEAEYNGFRTRVLNLSLYGAFLMDDRPYPTGRTLVVTIRLKENEEIVTQALVRRSLIREGMGVEFLHMSEEYYDRLRHFLITYQTGEGPETDSRQASEDKTEENTKE